MLLVAVGAGTSCRGSSETPDAPPGDSDALIDARPIANPDDGAPMRVPCVTNLGTGLTPAFGRLDGYLVSIVQPGAHGCNGDSSHIHLQVRALNETYDIAVNVGADTGSDDVHTLAADVELADLWTEGWHTGNAVLNDYPSTEKIHSADLTLETRATLTSEINADLATVNHISVFATGYGPDGAHLVHRDGNGHDGMLVMRPLSTVSHARYFSFTDQTF